MTPEQASKLRNDPAVKGTMSVEDIVKTAWEKHYKSKGVSLLAARMAVKRHAESGGQMYRFRNTIVIVKPGKAFDEVEFHTISADPTEVFGSMLVLFFMSFVRETGTKVAYTFMGNTTLYKSTQKLFGKNHVTLKELGSAGKTYYRMDIDIGAVYAEGEQRIAQQTKGRR